MEKIGILAHLPQMIRNLTLSDATMSLKNLLSRLPLIEGTVFLILATITVFRKRLSSNAQYRYSNSVKKELVISRSSNALSSTDSVEKNKSFIAAFPNTPTTSLVHAFNGVVQTVYQSTLQKPPIPTTSCQQGRLSLSSLTMDNILHIAEFLSSREIATLGAVSKSLQYDVQEDWLWEQLWKSRYYERIWNHQVIKTIREKRMIFWDPNRNFPNPQQGWKLFYREFEVCWKDWLLAGACSRDLCMLSLYGTILDVTAFLPFHPGSTESLTDFAGGDATEQFMDIGHSSHAFRISLEYGVFDTHLEPSMIEKSREFDSKVEEEFETAILNPIKRRYVPKFEDCMKSEAKIISAEFEGAYVSCAECQPMIPSVGGWAYNCISLPRDSRHVGQCRCCWDPLEQRWYTWFTCCGRGFPVNGYHSFLTDF